MALISTPTLAVVLDKLARFATMSVGDPEFNAGFNAGIAAANAAVMSGSNSIATYLLTLADEDVIADLLPPARDLDEKNPAAPDAFLLGIKEVNAMILAINAHLKRYAGAASLNAYLTSLNAVTPTLRAHGHFAKYLKTLSAGNVFIPNDMTIANFTETGASAGTFAHVAAIDTTSYGGAQLKVKNVGALTSSAVVTVTATKMDGTSTSLTATLSTHTDAAETALSDTAKLYKDVTAIAITTGTNLDAFKIIAKTDRSIASA